MELIRQLIATRDPLKLLFRQQNRQTSGLPHLHALIGIFYDEV